MLALAEGDASGLTEANADTVGVPIELSLVDADTDTLGVVLGLPLPDTDTVSKGVLVTPILALTDVLELSETVGSFVGSPVGADDTVPDGDTVALAEGDSELLEDAVGLRDSAEDGDDDFVELVVRVVVEETLGVLVVVGERV